MAEEIPKHICIQDTEKTEVRKHLRVHTKAGIIDVKDIDEYSAGRKWLHIRRSDGTNTPIRRTIILKIEREVGGRWYPVNLPKKIIL